MEGRFRQVEERFSRIEGELADLRAYINKQFAEEGAYVDSRFEEVKAYVDGKFAELDGRVAGLRRFVARRFDRLLSGFSSYQEFFIEYLTAEGLIERGKADLLKGELRRVVALVSTNPLTKEEVEKLRELIEKDELTLEEALWLREVARRLIREYGTPETWKLHIYASIWVGLARKKEAEKEKEEKRGESSN